MRPSGLEGTGLDRHDVDGLATLAVRLQAKAAYHGVDLIAQNASELAASLNDDDDDLLGVFQSANDLIDLCRSTQSSYLSEASQSTDRIAKSSVV